MVAGACVVAGGGCGCRGWCAWLLGVCVVVGGMHGCGGHVWLGSMRGYGGHAWLPGGV